MTPEQILRAFELENDGWRVSSAKSKIEPSNIIMDNSVNEILHIKKDGSVIIVLQNGSYEHLMGPHLDAKKSQVILPSWTYSH